MAAISPKSRVRQDWIWEFATFLSIAACSLFFLYCSKDPKSTPGKSSNNSSVVEKSGTQVLLYTKGSTSNITDDTTKNKIISTVESAITKSKSFLRLAALPAIIGDIKNTGLAIEIIYQDPISLPIEPYKDTVSINKVLIPLSGKYYPTAIFFSSDGAYTSGPLTYPNIGEEINMILE